MFFFLCLFCFFFSLLSFCLDDRIFTPFFVTAQRWLLHVAMPSQCDESSSRSGNSGRGEAPRWRSLFFLLFFVWSPPLSDSFSHFFKKNLCLSFSFELFVFWEERERDADIKEEVPLIFFLSFFVSSFFFPSSLVLFGCHITILVGCTMLVSQPFICLYISTYILMAALIHVSRYVYRAWIAIEEVGAAKKEKKIRTVLFAFFCLKSIPIYIVVVRTPLSLQRNDAYIHAGKSIPPPSSTNIYRDIYIYRYIGNPAYVSLSVRLHVGLSMYFHI